MIIIGAGIIGSSIAWRLAQRGVSVTLLEAGIMGKEASAAGAGMLAPGGEVAERNAWAALSVESARMYPEFVGELSSESNTAIDYRRSGAVALTQNDSEWGDLDQRAPVQEELGIESREIDSRDVSDLVPALDRRAYQRARYFPGDALVDARNVLSALRIACTARGVKIIENHPVRSLDGLEAGAIVIAAGAWSGLLGGAIPESYPVKGHLVGYNLPPGSIVPILRRNNTYILQRSSGFTIAGATTERAAKFDRTVRPEIAAQLHQDAACYLPSLLVRPPESAWIGFRPRSIRQRPEVRRLPGTNLWLAYGHYRNGILLAPITAKLIAGDIISSGETDLSVHSGIPQ